MSLQSYCSFQWCSAQLDTFDYFQYAQENLSASSLSQACSAIQTQVFSNDQR